MLMKTRISYLMVAAAMLLSRQVAAQTPSASVIPQGNTTDMVLGSASNLPYVSSAAGYTQQLVLNTELEGAAMITGIDLYCGSIKCFVLTIKDNLFWKDL